MADGFGKVRLLLRGRYTALSLRFHAYVWKRFCVHDRRRQLRAALYPATFLRVRSMELSLRVHTQY